MDPLGRKLKTSFCKTGIRTLAAILAMTGLCLLSQLAAQSPATKPAVQKHRLAIAVAVATTRPTTSPAAVECVVSCGPAVPISALAFSPDNHWLVVGGYQEVLVWDLTEAKLSRRLGAGQLNGVIHALAFLDGGKSLAVGDGMPGQACAVKIFDFEKGQVTTTFKEPADVVYSLAVSLDGKFLAAGGADKCVHVWNLETKQLATTIKENAECVFGVAFSQDGKYLSAVGADKTTRIWEVADWKSKPGLKETDVLYGAAFDQNNSLLAVAVGGPAEKAIHIWKIGETKVNISKVISTNPGLPLGMVWSGKTNRIYVPCDDKTVKVFYPSDGKLIATLRGHTDWVYGVAVNAEGTQVASGGIDGTVKIWNESDGKLLATLVQISARSDEWLILAADGNFTTSSPDAIRWESQGAAVVPANLTAMTQNAEAVKKVLSWKPAASPTSKPTKK